MATLLSLRLADMNSDHDRQDLTSGPYDPLLRDAVFAGATSACINPDVDSSEMVPSGATLLFSAKDVISQTESDIFYFPSLLSHLEAP